MSQEMPERLDLRTEDIAEDKREELLRLFPEVRTEGGKIDFERLKLLLGERIDAGKERYGMTWPGKADCFRTIQTPSMATLRPCPEESVSFDTTENLIIEGDNLEVLKLLQKSYLGKVKMIYIDPPYNTGNDFIYPDNYSESLQTYLEYTNQVDGQGKKFGTNTELDGRFHSKWLRMMYPRLYLAKNLLREDGVIFISIGDQELSSLRQLMNELFGEENYINTVCIKAKPSAGASGGGEDVRLKKNVEFLLVYVKNRDSDFALFLNQAFDETDLQEHIQIMRDEGRSWKYTRAVVNYGNRKLVKTTSDGEGNEIKVFRHDNYIVAPVSQLRIEHEDESKTYRRYFDKIFRDTNAQSSIRSRVMEVLGSEDGFFSIDYVPRSGRNRGKLTTVYYKGRNKDQLAWLKDIARCDDEKIYIRGKTGTLWADLNWNNVSKEGDMVFPNGKKPIALIQRMLQLATTASDGHLILDFFAGSGSTAHAVLTYNEQDNGNRKWIMVQLPEPCEIGDINKISDVCIERVRRATREIENEYLEQMELGQNQRKDCGFRVFKLAESNFKTWDAETPKNAQGLAQQLELHVNHIREDRSQSDLLYEILLKTGYPLTTPVGSLQLADKTVFSVAQGGLLVCLEKDISLELIRAMAEKNPQRVVCLDEGFSGNDQLKANAVQIFKTKGVVFKTV